MRDIEHQIAVAFVQWWAYRAPAFGLDPSLLFAIPNGGQRHPAIARKLKAEGVRAGVSDYILAFAKHPYNGLFLELKAGGKGFVRGRLSPDQVRFGQLVTERGYKFSVAYGTDEAISAIERYLMGQP